MQFIKTAAGRVTVFVHTGAESPEKTLELSLHAHAIGTDGVGIISPQFFGCSERMMETYYTDICGKLPAGSHVYLYNIPPVCCQRHLGILRKKSFLDMVRTTVYLDIGNGLSSTVLTNFFACYALALKL